MDNSTLKYILSQVKTCSYKIILIMGAGVTGKSYLAKQLNNALLSEGKSSAKIDLDGFLLDRKIRMRDKWITAHNPKAYDKLLLNNKLKKLIPENREVYLPIHDKKNHCSTLHKFSPSFYYIIEGAASFYFDVYNYADLKIYIWAEKDIQFSNRFVRESKGLGYGMEISKERFQLYWNDYIKYIIPMKEKADIIIKVNENYCGVIEETNQKCRTNG